MASASQRSGELLAAMRAVVFTAIRDHGREWTCERFDLSARSLYQWLKDWGVGKHQKPTVDPEDISTVANFLGLYTREKPTNVSCSMVHGLPSGLRDRIERATELALTGRANDAAYVLLSIKVDYPEL